MTCDICCYVLIGFIVGWLLCCWRCRRRMKKYGNSCGCYRDDDDCGSEESGN